jgi:uncharacterized coiled-coil protein SlyX
MDEQQLENRLTKLEESLDYIGEDIEEVKSTQADIHRLALSINTLAQQVKRIADDMCKVDGRLSTLESKPAQQWDNLVKTIITAIVAGLAGFALTKFIGG